MNGPLVGSPEAMKMKPPLDPPETPNCEEYGHKMRCVRSAVVCGVEVDVLRCKNCGKEEVD